MRGNREREREEGEFQVRGGEGEGERKGRGRGVEGGRGEREGGEKLGRKGEIGYDEALTTKYGRGS